MSFLDLAKGRYTTKKYDASKVVSEEVIEQLKEILRLSPSSINSQPWHFTFVSKGDVKNKLAAASLFNQHRSEDASHLVVFSVIDDVAIFEKQIEANLPEGSVAYYNSVLKPQSETVVKNWMQHQVYLALGFFLSACASMGIDSTPMEGIDINEYDNILKIDGYKPLFAVAIGYRNEADDNQPSITPKSRLNKGDVIDSI